MQGSNRLSRAPTSLLLGHCVPRRSHSEYKQATAISFCRQKGRGHHLELQETLKAPLSNRFSDGRPQDHAAAGRAGYPRPGSTCLRSVFHITAAGHAKLAGT